MATNTGILGMTRLAYNLSKHRQLPASLGSIHRRFRTPYLAVVVFSLISVIMLLPGLFSRQHFINLAALYVFAALLVFASAHISILRLRMIHPDKERPFRLLGNIKIHGIRLPVTAVLGLLSTIVIWLIVIITHPYIWWIGVIWLLIGFLVFYVYRKSQHLPLRNTSEKAREKNKLVAVLVYNLHKSIIVNYEWFIRRFSRLATKTGRPGFSCTPHRTMAGAYTRRE